MHRVRAFSLVLIALYLQQAAAVHAQACVADRHGDLVVALQNRSGPVSSWELMQIAAIQQAISAFEDVIADLDAEMEMEAAA